MRDIWVTSDWHLNHEKFLSFTDSEGEESSAIL